MSVVLHLPTPDGLHRRCDGQEWLTFLIPVGASIPMCEHCWNDTTPDPPDLATRPPKEIDDAPTGDHPTLTHARAVVRALAERLDRPDGG